MYEDIQEKVEKVISFSQGISDIDAGTLIEQWAESKAKFLEIFGGPIYEYPVTVEFTLDEKSQSNNLEDFLYTIESCFHNKPLRDFIDDNKDAFYDNVVIKSSRKEIPVGMKLLRAFKFFEPDKAALERIQNIASQYIQANKCQGTLCFSVHPLDFLSSSENNHNWRSCHALDGEYRSGNLSYMTDNSTFMVYLKSEAECKLLAFPESVPWNSKKWRVLLHQDPEDLVLFAGRQYPFSAKGGLDTALDVYNLLFAKYLKDNSLNHYNISKPFRNWSNEYIDTYSVPGQTTKEYLWYKYLPLYGYLRPIYDVVKVDKNALLYNDIGCSTIYKYPYYTTRSKVMGFMCRDFKDIRLSLGNKVKCLYCGKQYLKNTDSMVCDNCLDLLDYQNDKFTNCSSCGCRIYYDDGNWYDVGDDIVCEHCTDFYTFYCDNCNERFWRSNTREIWSEHLNEYVCEHCFEVTEVVYGSKGNNSKSKNG